MAWICKASVLVALLLASGCVADFSSDRDDPAGASSDDEDIDALVEDESGGEDDIYAPAAVEESMAEPCRYCCEPWCIEYL
jgi:hypothetical protein